MPVHKRAFFKMLHFINPTVNHLPFFSLSLGRYWGPLPHLFRFPGSGFPQNPWILLSEDV